MKKQRNILLAYSVIILIILSTIAGALFSVPVLALPPALLKARTIGELIITLFAGAGTAITNPVVVPAIYSNYSGVDYNIESLVNDGIIYDPSGELSKQEIIEQLGSIETIRPRAFDLDTTAFRELMSTNWESMREYGIDAVMRLNDIANTDTVYGAIDNIGQFLVDVANYGYLGFENSIAIVTNPGTAVNVGFNAIKDAVIDYYGGSITKGIPMASNTGVVPAEFLSFNSIGAIKGTGSNQTTFSWIYYSLSDNVKCGLCIDNNNYIRPYAIRANGSTDKFWYAQYFDGALKNNSMRDFTAYAAPSVSGILDVAQPIYKADNSIIYNNSFTYADFTLDELYQYALSLRNGEIDNLNGILSKPNNDFVNQDQGNINNPISILPAIDNNKNITIIPQSEYEPFVEEVKQNTDDGVPEDNAILLEDLINDNSSENESTDDPDDPIVHPDQPIQPTVVPKPTNIPEETSDVINSLGTPGLETVFPFCLPFDLDYLFRKFQAEPQAPYFVLPLKSELFGIDEEVVVDLSMFDDIASLLRTLISIGYIVFLIFNTRSMIGAGSNG